MLSTMISALLMVGMMFAVIVAASIATLLIFRKKIMKRYSKRKTIRALYVVSMLRKARTD
jgi:peptidoglycan/LPS O-acetylase OafA/YrhL